jgi:hypothetical protein
LFFGELPVPRARPAQFIQSPAAAHDAGRSVTAAKQKVTELVSNRAPRDSPADIPWTRSDLNGGAPSDLAVVAVIDEPARPRGCSVNVPSVTADAEQYAYNGVRQSRMLYVVK